MIVVFIPSLWFGNVSASNLDSQSDQIIDEYNEESSEPISQYGQEELFDELEPEYIQDFDSETGGLVLIDPTTGDVILKTQYYDDFTE